MATCRSRPANAPTRIPDIRSELLPVLNTRDATGIVEFGTVVRNPRRGYLVFRDVYLPEIEQPCMSIGDRDRSTAVSETFDWEAFLGRHDLVWKERFPREWQEAPYFGNGLLGSMLYRDGDRDRLRLQVFRTDVQDHREDRYGWTAYSRRRGRTSPGI